VKIAADRKMDGAGRVDGNGLLLKNPRLPFCPEMM
jgi:hypothetical protein